MSDTNRKLAVSVLVLLAALVATTAAGQQPASTTAFPSKYLEGPTDFNLALSFQGDLRGNFGPCG